MLTLWKDYLFKMHLHFLNTLLEHLNNHIETLQSINNGCSYVLLCVTRCLGFYFI